MKIGIQMFHFTHLQSLSQNFTGRTYEVMKIALPKKGFSGVEKKADTAAWTNNMAESIGNWLRVLEFISVLAQPHWCTHKHITMMRV